MKLRYSKVDELINDYHDKFNLINDLAKVVEKNFELWLANCVK